uniref:Lipid-binding serum glycoprotein N-terminal domain-containing protein n=1 Tax=Photinus pyralis TaxID=7054 RepID=A0A1Y1LMX5_PHOPY
MQLWKKILVVFALCSVGQVRAQDDALTNLIKANPRMFENEINGVFDYIKQMIKNGIFGLSLDPFHFPWLPVNLEHESIRSKLHLRDISFEGLSDFEVNPATVEIGIFPPKGTFKLGLFFKAIKFGTNYDGTLKILQLLNLFGKGKFRFELDQLKINVEVEATPIPLKITKAKITLGLPSTDWEVTGLFNDEHLSSIITLQLKDALNSLATEYEGALNTLINEGAKGFIGIINTFLEGKTIQDIIDMITGGGNGGSTTRGILDCKKASVQALNFVNATYGAELGNYFKSLQVETY